jgi:DNA repair protein SbcD/Mre11
MGGSARERCFVHAADLHLDTPFVGVEAESRELAALLRDASLDALDRLVEVALDRQAAFVVLAGDIYDGSERGLRAQLRFRDALARLDEAGIPTFVVHGNHDPVEEGWQAIRHWPEGVTVFGEAEVDSVPVHDDGRRIATVHGISYATRAVSENLATRFERTAAPGVHVGLLHATVGSQPEHDTYAPCTLADLRAARMDYWALGHVHRRQVVHRGQERGDPWVVYPGNTQARSIKPSERGAKGCYVVPIDPDAGGSPIGEPEFVPLDSVRFGEAVVEIDDVDEIPELADRLLAAGDQARDEADGRALVLRARLAGRGPLHHELARPGVHDQLLQRLRDAVRDLDPPLWWDALGMATRPVLDRETLRERADFTGELVRLVDELRRDPQTGGLGEDADEILERLEPPPRAVPVAELLAEAEARALDLLSEEG